MDTQVTRMRSEERSRILKLAWMNRMLPPPRPKVPVPAKATIREVISDDDLPEDPPQAIMQLPMAPSPKLHLGMFEIGKPLGKGKFGRVYLAKHRISGYICALKVLDKEEIRRENAEVHVRREIEVHSNLRHPGILAFHTWFHDSRRIFLILDYAPGGELYKVLRKVGCFSEKRAAQYVAQVAEALSYLHKKNIMHRDIKPENILLGPYGELKLADFGYSVHTSSNRRDTLCGTLDYLPPEMLATQKKKYTSAVDQWTLGVLTYEFLTGEAPFEEEAARLTKLRISKGEMKPLPHYLSPMAKNFVQSLLKIDAKKRLPLDQVLTHPWIVRNCTRG